MTFYKTNCNIEIENIHKGTIWICLFITIAFKILSFFTFIPVIGPYIQSFIDGSKGYQKKNDKPLTEV